MLLRLNFSPCLFQVLLLMYLHCITIESEADGGIFVDGHSNNQVEYEQFITFMSDFEKTYENAFEQTKRFEIFKNNLQRAKELNKKEKGTAVYGVTIFSDLTADEFQRKYLSPPSTLRFRNQTDSHFEIPVSLEYPESVRHEQQNTAAGCPEYWSWITNPFYPPVDNQGQCGICGMFGLAGVLEVVYSNVKRSPTLLSKQQLLDCSTLGGCDSGNGVYMKLLPIMTTINLEKQVDYPYEAKMGSCRADKKKGVATVAKYDYVNDGERGMVQVVKKQPVPIELINPSILQTYVSGIINDCPFTEVMPTHGVAVIGYGTEKNAKGEKIDYWEVRNSWGKDWGLAGHFKLRRNTNACALLNDAYNVTVKVL